MVTVYLLTFIVGLVFGQSKDECPRCSGYNECQDRCDCASPREWDGSWDHVKQKCGGEKCTIAKKKERNVQGQDETYWEFRCCLDESCMDSEWESYCYCYLNRYGDLFKEYEWSCPMARWHYYEHGKEEGRSKLCGFDFECYISRYTDLNDFNYTQAKEHWENHGYNEKRIPWCDFDCSCYLGRYADLRAEYGTNCAAAYAHWLHFGMSEGRKPHCGTALFDCSCYLDRYADLREEYGNKCAAAYAHWLHFGMSEGRKAHCGTSQSLVNYEIAAIITPLVVMTFCFIFYVVFYGLKRKSKHYNMVTQSEEEE